MDKNLLIRILTGEANSREKEEFYSSLAKNEHDEKLFYEIKSLWLRTSLPQTKINPEAEFDHLWGKINPKKKTKRFGMGQTWLRYAAAIVLLLNIGGLAGYFISEPKPEVPVSDTGIQKYTATKGSVSTLEFADGTKIWLNSGSELTYQENHKTNQRLAELHGEAFFEVKHREDFPLLVKVGQLTVRDLGTTFNIKAYPQEHTIETCLLEGKADILSSTGTSVVTLAPGESALYNSSDNQIKLRLFEPTVLSGWRDGKFVIRDQRLEDIFREISHWYDVEFEFKNQALRDYRYTGNLKKSTTALLVLKMLQVTAKFQYKIIEHPDKPDEIVIY
jgi:ferric-dicitrate binding protein FerR (iron transport regulator)